MQRNVHKSQLASKSTLISQFHTVNKSNFWINLINLQVMDPFPQFPKAELGILFIEPSSKCALWESGYRIGYEPTKNELRSLSAVDFQGYQRGGLSILRSCDYHTVSCTLHLNVTTPMISLLPGITDSQRIS